MGRYSSVILLLDFDAPNGCDIGSLSFRPPGTSRTVPQESHDFVLVCTRRSIFGVVYFMISFRGATREGFGGCRRVPLSVGCAREFLSCAYLCVGVLLCPAILGGTIFAAVGMISTIPAAENYFRP